MILLTPEAVPRMEDIRGLLQISMVPALPNAMFLDAIIILQKAVTQIVALHTQINAKIVIATLIETLCIVCLAYIVPQTKITVHATNAMYVAIMPIKNTVVIITVLTALNL